MEEKINDLKEDAAITQEQINNALQGVSKYHEVNRVPLIKNEYRKEFLIKLQELFLCELYEAVEKEKQLCDKIGTEPNMSGATLEHIEGLVTSATDWLELEAIWEFVFKDNIVPTKEEVLERAKIYDTNLGGLDK